MYHKIWGNFFPLILIGTHVFFNIKLLILAFRKSTKIIGDYIMSFIGMLGAQVGAGVVGSASEYLQRGADKVFGIDRKQEQIDQQRKLQDLQIEGNKSMLDYSSMLQRKMWDYTNYSNQRKHMEEAGLNPAMMYGMSGGGGSTVGNASGSVSGATASTESQLRANEIAQQGNGI